MSLSLTTPLPASPSLMARLGRFLARVADHMYRHGIHLHGCCMAVALVLIAGHGLA